MKRNFENRHGNVEIIGGNLPVDDGNELVNWEKTLQKLGFTQEEIVIVIASSFAKKFIEDFENMNNKVLTPEERKKIFKDLMALYDFEE